MAEIDHWRKRFSSSDIFEVIEKAILFAARDRPKDFPSRREELLENLYAERKEEGRGRLVEEKEERRRDRVEPQRAKRKEKEEKGDVEEEIWRIKKILYSKDEKSGDALLESLKRLQQMDMTPDVLKATEIGKVVNGFPTFNKSKQLCQLLSTIIKNWKLLEGYENGAAKKQRIK